MMIAAELLAEYDGPFTIEMVPLNGEDYYAAPGEMLWFEENQPRMDEIVLGMNADGAGYLDRDTAVSFYGVPDDMRAVIEGAMSKQAGFAEGEQWFQSDHSIIAQQGRPALAVTTTDFAELCELYAHTADDTIELVDPAIVVQVARFYADVIRGLDAIARS